jgi:hypothetical protein
LAHGFVFEFGGISFRTHGLSPMAIRTPEFVYQTGESPSNARIFLPDRGKSMIHQSLSIKTKQVQRQR